MATVACKQCGREIQEATAARNAGLCQPCAKGFRWTTCRQCGKEFRSEGGGSDVCFKCNPPTGALTTPAPAAMIVDVVLKCFATKTSEEQTITNLMKLGLGRDQAAQAIDDTRSGKGYSNASADRYLGRFRLTDDGGISRVDQASPPKKWWQFWR